MNGGTQLFGDITLQQGNGTTIVDSGSGIITISTSNGGNEFIVTAGSGLTANYTGGRVNINGVITDIPSGSINLNNFTSNGTIYVNSAGMIAESSSNVFPPDSVPLAIYTTGVSTITSITDKRVFLGNNLVFGTPITQIPDQTNSIGTTDNFAMADHVHNIPTLAPITQAPDQTNADGVASSFSRSDHVHNIPTATAFSVGPANTQGSSTSFSRADHIHQGVHSLNANGGNQRFNDLTLQQGSGVNISDNGTGIFTVSTSNGANELLVTAGSGLIANYTGGRVNINGTITNIPAGSITLPASISNGTIYVNTLGIVTDSTNSIFGANVVPLATFTTGATTISSIIDQRVFLGDNVLFGTPISQIPDQTNAVGTTNNFAMADHTHNIPTSAPIITLSATTTNSQGSATTFSRSDHIHSITTGAPVTQTPDQSNTIGSSSNLARADHIHNIPTLAPITQTPDQTNADGGASTFSRSDHVHNIPTGIPITTLSATTTNSQGSASTFSRSDHIHAIATGPPVTQTPDQTNTIGSSANLARSDHIHNIPTFAPITQAPNQTNADGVAFTFSRSDHVHNIPTSIAVSVGTTNTQGVSTSFSQSDHTHQGIHSLNANGDIRDTEM